MNQIRSFTRRSTKRKTIRTNFIKIVGKITKLINRFDSFIAKTLNVSVFILRLNISVNLNVIITMIRLGVRTTFDFNDLKIRGAKFLIETRLTFIIKTFNDNIIRMQDSNRIVRFVLTFSTFLLSKQKTPMIILITFLDLVKRVSFRETIIFNKIKNKLFFDIIRKHNKIFIGTKTSERINIIFIIRETWGFETTISPLIFFLVKFITIKHTKIVTTVDVNIERRLKIESFE